MSVRNQSDFKKRTRDPWHQPTFEKMIKYLIPYLNSVYILLT